MFKDFKKLCTPAKLYFALAVLGSVLALVRGIPFLPIGIRLIFAFIWTMILGWLCKKGMTTLSWVLVLLPYIVMLLAMFRIANFSREHSQITSALKLEPGITMEGFRAAPARRTVASNAAAY